MSKISLRVDFKTEELMEHLTPRDCVEHFNSKNLLKAIGESDIVDFCETHFSDEVLEAIGKMYVVGYFNIEEKE